ncbi:MAG: Gfo/Idh/MocA family oxidoreductase [DPANN group archaeon]|nr:Gfo/Idh/MocA family oxidoreductase [DPANN group archaeon]
MKVGVIGCGYWGSKLVKEFYDIVGKDNLIACDLSEQRLVQVKEKFGVETTKNISEAIKKADALAVATPVFSHYTIARKVLKAGKHAFVEKPIAKSYSQSLKLVGLASQKNVKLMVDSTFIYSAAIRKAKELIDCGEIGAPKFVTSRRLNLGLYQADKTNVIWDLAPHDIAIIAHLLEDFPNEVSAFGTATVIKDVADNAHMILKFPKGQQASIHMSWLHPFKVRETIVVGSEKMLVYNLDKDPQIEVHDKGVILKNSEPQTAADLEYKHSAIYPHLVSGALPDMCKHFLECIKENKTPTTDGVYGAKIVKVLENADKSLHRNGKTMQINY